MIEFRVVARSGQARAGTIATPHGVVQTPAFMPVGTYGAVKGIAPDELGAMGTRLLITNTYHLWLRPGAELIAELGGVHAFMRWPHAVATDSGGFQAFSLARRVEVAEVGMRFSSHLDGQRLLLSPEEAMRIQGLLGSDIAMQLDVCPPAGAPRQELLDAVARTTRWAERCLSSRVRDQALFGIIQGGTDVDLRLRHAQELAALPLDGLALGGFSVGEPPEDMHRTLEQVVPHVDPERPRYLMGVGTPRDLLIAIGAGVDLFDCVLPTRNARTGQAFTRRGRLNLDNARFKNDPAPIEEGCGCPACAGGFSRAYVRHLQHGREMLGHRLVTLHNLWFYAELTREARAAVQAGSHAEWSRGRLAELQTAG